MSKHIKQKTSKKIDIDEQYDPFEEEEQILEEQIGLSSRKRKKIEKVNINNQGQVVQINNYFWSFSENMRYKAFLEENIDLMERSLQEKKIGKVNVKMSSFLKSRTTNQCRSHHQKMLKRHKTIGGIISFLERQAQTITEQKDGNGELERKKLREESQTVSSPSQELRIIEDWQENSPDLWEELIGKLWN